MAKYYKETEKRQFATGVLQGIGAPVTEDNISFLLRWMNQEDSRNEGSKVPLEKIAINRFNPFNTTYSKGAISTLNKQGVKGYASMEDGIKATVGTLLQRGKNYEGVIDALKSSDTTFDIFKSAVKISDWGTFDDGGAGNAGNSAVDFGITSGIIARALLINPEVGAIFKKYLGQSGDDVQQAIATDLRGTKWWQTQSSRAREVITSSLSQDNATYAESKKNEIARITTAALGVGATLTDAEINDLANQTMLFGLSDADLNTALVGSLRMDKNYIKGQAGTVSRSLASRIDSYGYDVRTDSPEFKTYVSDILRGTRKEDDVVGMFQNMAANNYPKFADRFKAGASLNDITSSAKYTISNILEQSLDSIRNNNKYVQQYLSAGGMNDYDLERAVISDPTSGWEYTKNSQKKLLNPFTNLINIMGGEV
jgi:hypothetical protein